MKYFDIPALIERKRESLFRVTPIGGPEERKKWLEEQKKRKKEIAELQAFRNTQIRTAAVEAYVADLTKLGVEEAEQTTPKETVKTKVTKVISKVWSDAFRGSSND